VPLSTTAPRPVLVAGTMVALQGLTGVVFAVAVLIHALTAAGKLAGAEFGETGYFVVLSAAVLAVAYGLLKGRRWSRTPAAMLQLLLLGVCYYVLGPSGQVLAGVLVAIYCVAVIVLLFLRESRVWAARQYN
jgi:hypothetical protein